MLWYSYCSTAAARQRRSSASACIVIYGVQDKVPVGLLAGLAAVVGKVFLPSITSDSVQKAVEANPEKFVVSQKGGIIATEEILEHVEDHIGTFLLG